MRILGWILAALGALSAFFGAGMGISLLIGSSALGGVATFLGVFFFSILPLTAGAGMALFGRHFLRKSQREEAARLEDKVRALCAKGGGTFTLSDAARALDLPREEVDRRLRPLVGRQVLDLEFKADGELVYTLSPLAESRARLGQ